MDKKDTIYIEDNIYLPRHEKYKHRNTVRCILLNDKKEIGLLLIDRDDDFGKMKHLETPGGGVEYYETNEQALIREMYEEVGCSIKNIFYLCRISNEYNLIKRIDHASFYLAFVKEMGDNHLMEDEIGLINGVIWIPICEYKKYYDEYPAYKVANIIYKRDQIAIEFAIKYLKEHNLL